MITSAEDLVTPAGRRREICPWEDQAKTLQRVGCQLTNEMRAASMKLMTAAHEIRLRDRQIDEARALAQLLVMSGMLPKGMTRETLSKRYPWLKQSQKISPESGN